MAPVTPLLETRGLSKRYGGLEAVSGVDFRLDRGEVRALIGPNGAGKTTLVGIISGRVTPTAGEVRFAGRDITRRPAWERAALGIVYTFQVTSIYRNLSVHDNVALGRAAAAPARPPSTGSPSTTEPSRRPWRRPWRESG